MRHIDDANRADANLSQGPQTSGPVVSQTEQEDRCPFQSRIPIAVPLSGEAADVFENSSRFLGAQGAKR